MKTLAIISTFLFCFSLTGMVSAENRSHESSAVFNVFSPGGSPEVVPDNPTVIVDNDKMRVTKFTSLPGEDVCGKGRHSHIPHLTIMLTNASVLVTSSEGEEKSIDLDAGATFWNQAETHSVVNTGDKEIQVLLVELKEDLNAYNQ